MNEFDYQTNRNRHHCVNDKNLKIWIWKRIVYERLKECKKPEQLEATKEQIWERWTSIFYVAAEPWPSIMDICMSFWNIYISSRQHWLRQKLECCCVSAISVDRQLLLTLLNSSIFHCSIWFLVNILDIRHSLTEGKDHWLLCSCFTENP